MVDGRKFQTGSSGMRLSVEVVRQSFQISVKIVEEMLQH